MCSFTQIAHSECGLLVVGLVPDSDVDDEGPKDGEGEDEGSSLNIKPSLVKIF